ncbi:ABC transporter ATP-binding protein [uncultured Nocardioides sp.]|uniref:ABC transporter ATP-binding protein n=1 Tax=uncultured Nocardioides sp. TaxID=198441 RepID=UPI0026193B3C|nr:ABC transporter ATP-binding protein [uncultured Nocardioides sp.]
MIENSHAPAVEVDGLRKTYADKVAVEDVSFRVEPGEVFGILGPNGAGKTTTVESVCGLRVGDAGTVRVHGIDPWTDHEAITRIVGVQLQESRMQPKLTVREALELWTAFYDDPMPWADPAERLGLVDHLDQRFGTLSGGQQQRLSIALALIGRPRVAILDELSTGLDPRARREVWSLVRDLRDRGTTVLLVTHGMEEAEALCDRVAIIDRGRVRAVGTPSDLVGGAAAATVTSFEPSEAVDLVALRELEGVADVRADAGRVTVTGAEDAAVAVLTRLASRGVVPHRLRVVDGSLDSAYLDLTLDNQGAAPEEVTA